ncbi:MAG: myo-inositol-1(or 4)-monophosphatase [Saprospiraceae bacterium]|jgi:myo-inositol-1(or 4)-monophosphatase|tara:strand:- start:106 stop:915 length:810 start_codon:yes stop_codon:yes gene_type:complete
MFTQKELEIICDSAKKIISEVAIFIRTEKNKVSKADIEQKGLNDLVSYVDKTAEMRLVEKLGQLLPLATFITEESTIENKKSAYYWVIDPLDGTTNFLHGIPHFAISVALVHKEVPIIGIIQDVMRDDSYSAYKNGGAFLNGERIQVSQSTRVLDSVLGMGFPYSAYENMDSVSKSVNYFLRNARGLRRIGSAALDLAYVAIGYLDAFHEVNLKAWDVAAGICIVQEAGGIVQDFSAKNNFLFGGEIIASNPNIAKELQGLIYGFYIDS